MTQEQEKQHQQALMQEVDGIMMQMEFEELPRIHPDAITDAIMAAHPALKGEDAEFHLSLSREHIRTVVTERMAARYGSVLNVGSDPTPADILAAEQAYVKHAEELRRFGERRKQNLTLIKPVN